MSCSVILIIVLAVSAVETAAHPIDRCRLEYRQQLREIASVVSRIRMDSRDMTSEPRRCNMLKETVAESVRRRGYNELGLSRAAKESLLAKISVEIESKMDCLPQVNSGLRSLVAFMRKCDEPGFDGAQVGASRAEVNKEQETLKKRLSDQDKTINELKREIAEIESKLQSKTSEESERKADLEAKEAQLARLSGELASLESGAQDLRASLEGKTKAHEESLAELAARDEAIRKLKTYVETLETNLKSTFNANKANEIEATKRAAEVEKLKGELASLKSSLESKTAAGGERVEQIRMWRNLNVQTGLGVDTILQSVFVVQVNAGSPAARAGLRFGDQILATDGKSLANMDLPEVLGLGRLENTYTVRRSPFELTFVLNRGTSTILGLTINDHQISTVVRDSPAARAGVLAGFTIIGVNGKSMIGLSDFAVESILTQEADPEIRLTVLPRAVYDLFIRNINMDKVRSELNKIADDEKMRDN